MSSNKPRILHSNKDMIMTIIPLILISFAIAGIATQCSFHPGPPQMGNVPSFDARGALEYDAETLDFPIRIPDAPDGWQANSGKREDVTGEGAGTVTSVGYVTDRYAYVRYSQADTSVEQLVRYHLPGAEAAGTRVAGGQEWAVYRAPGAQDPRADTLWVADLGDVRLALVGTGREEDFTTMAQAVLAAQPL